MVRNCAAPLVRGGRSPPRSASVSAASGGGPRGWPRSPPAAPAAPLRRDAPVRQPHTTGVGGSEASVVRASLGTLELADAAAHLADVAALALPSRPACTGPRRCSCRRTSVGQHDMGTTGAQPCSSRARTPSGPASAALAGRSGPGPCLSLGSARSRAATPLGQREEPCGPAAPWKFSKAQRPSLGNRHLWKRSTCPGTFLRGHHSHGDGAAENRTGQLHFHSLKRLPRGRWCR